MRALDTGVLLALLEGSTKVRDLLRKSKGEEIATTEANVLELAYLAAASPARGRTARLAALDKLRQRLTVLPIDSRATQQAIPRLARQGERLSPTVTAMFGALQAAGCQELLTDEPGPTPGSWAFRVKVVRV